MARPTPRRAVDAKPALEYELAVRAYDRRTRAAFEVMGLRYNRFAAAKDAFRAAPPSSPEWYSLGERMYRLGVRSTHAYYLWIQGHTRVAGTPPRAELRLVGE